MIQHDVSRWGKVPCAWHSAESGLCMAAFSMTRRLYARLRLISPLLCRGFWLLMVVVHALGLIATWRSYLTGIDQLSALIAGVTLSLSMLFFLLKVWGVSFLKVRPTKAAWVAACLLIAWIHLDCVDPTLTGELSGSYADLVATTVLFGGVTQVSRTVRVVFERSLRLRSRRAPGAQAGGIAWFDEFHPRCWVLASRLFMLRAPPA